MSDQTIDGVPRELIERIRSRLNETGQFLLSEELHAAVAVSVPIIGGEVDRLNGMLDAASELLRTKERVNRALRSELERIKAINDNNFNLVLDRLFDEPAAQGEPVAHGTNSDKYKAELYDEVWQKARSLGFGSVTDALASLEKRGEPVAWIKPDVAKTLVKDECCYAFGGQNPAGTLIPLYA